MNKTEQEYSYHLEAMVAGGRVLWFRYEGIKLRLADKTFYTPDFAVMMADGTIELHEIKGHWEDAARIKIKVASEQYPFQFRAFTKAAKKDGGGWKEEVFGDA